MLESKFYLDRVDHAELMQILLEFFGHGQYSDINTFRFYKQDNKKIYLEILISKKGEIIKFPNYNITSEEIGLIKQTIKEKLIESKEIIIGQCIIYCHTEEVTGYFKYKDLFQILPIPSNAPRANFKRQARNPFLLQLKYKSSPSICVDNFRKMYLTFQYVHLLNLFLNFHILLESDYTDFYWILDKDNSARLAQSYYNFNGFKQKINCYTDTSSMRSIELISAKKYYSSDLHLCESLTIPHNLEQSFNLALNLSELDKDKFYRACAWLYNADEIWNQSSSSALISLVTAIECLLEKEKDICDCCNQQLYLTKNFNEFIEHYSSADHRYKTTKKILYNTRSLLAHGEQMFSLDTKPSSLFDINMDKESFFKNDARYIVSSSIYNWLWTRHSL